MRLLKMPKLLFVCALLGIMCANFSAHAQSEKLYFEERTLTVAELFKEIQDQIDFKFFYSDDNLDATKTITLEKSEWSLEEVLTKVLGDKHTFSVKNKTVVISPVTESSSASQEDKQIVISGRVTNEFGEPLFGAVVAAQGVSKGAITDDEGYFKMPIPASAETLQVRYIGMKSQTIVIGNQSEFQVQMQEDVSELEQVVITGMFERRKETFTGASQTFTNEEITRVGKTNIIQSLSSLDPSFQIADNIEFGSDPNTLPQITLRGQSGFPDLKGEYSSNPNQPLFILDGFEATLKQIVDLDMFRVASITLLKDASAKAIYGSRAANGVVVIETHKPKEGKLRVRYTGTVPVTAPDLSSYNLTNSSEKLQVEMNAGIYDDVFDDMMVYNERLEEVLRGVDTDWLAQPTRVGIGQRHTLYLEGGDSKMTYGIDFSRNNVKGVMKGSDRTTTSGGLSFVYRHGKFSLREQLYVTHNEAHNSPWGSFSTYASLNPYYRTHDEYGNVLKVLGYNHDSGSPILNPMYNATINTLDMSEYTQFRNNIVLEYTPIIGMRIRGRLTIDHEDSGSETFLPASHTNFVTYTSEELRNRRGTYDYYDGQSSGIAGDINVNYTKTLGKHILFGNVGWTIEEDESNSASFMAEGFPNDYLEDINFARQYAKNGSPSGSESTTRSMSYLGAASYSYNDRYQLEGSIRMSASSQYGSDNPWGQFWSAGASWNLHNESFIQDLGFINQLKVRGSLGYTGSENFNSSMAKATYSYGNSQTYLERYGAYLMGIENTSLRWQRKYDQNVGVDFSVFNSKLGGRIDYYIANTDDLLTDVTVPSSTGFTTYKENLGQVQNKGIEVALNYRLISIPEKQIYVNVYANGNRNTNKVRKISNSLETYNSEQAAEVTNKPIVRYTEGQSLNAIWAVPSYGIDPVSGQEILISQDGSVTFDWNSDDLIVAGDALPKWNGNMGFNAGYAGFTLNVNASYRIGGQTYNSTLVQKVENANVYNNVDRRVFSDRWVNPGDESRFKDVADETTTRATSRFVEDLSELKISSVNMSYDFSRMLDSPKNPFNTLRLSFDMTDVLYLSTVEIERGTSYPFARTFTFSLQASF